MEPYFGNSFVYIWTDKLSQMKYIGVHKGTLGDGYVSSRTVNG
jgi:hypothetical protein